MCTRCAASSTAASRSSTRGTRPGCHRRSKKWISARVRIVPGLAHHSAHQRGAAAARADDEHRTGLHGHDSTRRRASQFCSARRVRVARRCTSTRVAVVAQTTVAGVVAETTVEQALRTRPRRRAPTERLPTRDPCWRSNDSRHRACARLGPPSSALRGTRPTPRATGWSSRASRAIGLQLLEQRAAGRRVDARGDADVVKRRLRRRTARAAASRRRCRPCARDNPRPRSRRCARASP